MDTNNLSFHKIHGASNDFVVVDARQLEVDWAGLARRVCHRHRGIGADGVLLVQDSDDADFRMRLFNADGSEAEMCGNGIRCTHKFALDTGLSTSRRLTWETGGGRVTTELLDYDDGVARVQVDMGMPRFRPNEIPVDFRGEEVMEGAFSVNGADLALTCVSMGNPHAIAFVDSVDNFALDHIGPLVERHRAFPQRTNFEIAEVLAPNHLKMRVWERGVGETQACGSGACAVAVASQRVRHTDSVVDIDVPGGRLQVDWAPGHTVLMTGPAETSFTGEVELRRA